MRNFSFFLGTDEYQKELKLDHLNQFPEVVCNALFSSGEYQIQSDVDFQNLKTFIDFFVDKTQVPSINCQNSYDFHQLSIEFNILQDYFLSRQVDHIYKLSVLQKSKSNDIKDKSSYEQSISRDLDYFITNHPLELLELPVHMLYNIFNNKNRKLNDHKKAYMFITNQQNKNKNLFTLLSSLDGSMLTDKMCEESISLQQERFGFIPQFSMKEFQQQEDIPQQATERDLRKMIKSSRSEIKKLHKQMSKIQYISDYQKKQISENNEIIKEQQKTIYEYERKNDELLKKLEYFQQTFKKQTDDLDMSEITIHKNENKLKKKEYKIKELEKIIQIQSKKLCSYEDTIKNQANKISQYEQIIESYNNKDETDKDPQERSLTQKIFDMINPFG